MEDFFQSLSETLSFPVDQVRYLFLFVCSFPLAFFFRQFLSPAYFNLAVRYVFSASVGILFIFICFKRWEGAILLAFVAVSYLLLLFIPPSVVHWYMMLYAFSCVVGAHVYRMIVDYEGWHQDFTGPLMVLVQRVTSVSCALHDGMGKKLEDLNKDQLEQKLSRKPSALEYFGYNFNFLSVLAGPMYSFKDYTDFMTAVNLKPLDNPNQYGKAKEHGHAPSPFIPVLTKAGKAVMFMLLTFPLSHFTPHSVLNPSLTLPVRMVYVSVSAFRVRCLYYFVFLLTESICNTAGLGFNGYDKRGVARWDLVTNVDPFHLEFGTNTREQVQAWNIATGTWIKRCIYERMTFSPTLMSWVMSALWHGLYPGYFISFVTFALATVTARKVRKRFWKRYQSPPRTKLLYDIVTCSATSLGRDFAALPFILLTFERALALWKFYYFIPLILCSVIYFALPNGKTESKKVNGYQNHQIKKE